MLRSIKEIHDYKIIAVDGEVGEVYDFLFDDHTWTIRYLVNNTGPWLLERKILISPVALDQPDWESQRFPVSLTKQQIKDSPDIDTDKPVSRQQEQELRAYYQWPSYWPEGGGLLIDQGVMPYMKMQAIRELEAQENEGEEGEVEERVLGDPNLRSTKEVINYYIQARDGQIGHVEDFIVDDETWNLNYIVVDTRNWLPGKKVLVAPEWIKEVNWAIKEVQIDLSRETIKNSPPYNPTTPINNDYTEELYDYYGRPQS